MAVFGQWWVINRCAVRVITIIITIIDTAMSADWSIAAPQWPTCNRSWSRCRPQTPWWRKTWPLPRTPSSPCSKRTGTFWQRGILLPKTLSLKYRYMPVTSSLTTCFTVSVHLHSPLVSLFQCLFVSVNFLKHGSLSESAAPLCTPLSPPPPPHTHTYTHTLLSSTDFQFGQFPCHAVC